MAPESSSHTDHSGEGLNCTQSQQQQHQNAMSVNTIYNKNKGSLYTQRSDKKKIVQELTVSVYRFFFFEKNHHIFIEFIWLYCGKEYKKTLVRQSILFVTEHTYCKCFVWCVVLTIKNLVYRLNVRHWQLSLCVIRWSRPFVLMCRKRTFSSIMAWCVCVSSEGKKTFRNNLKWLSIIPYLENVHTLKGISWHFGK